MRWVRLGAVASIATVFSIGAGAADLAYPPPAVMPPQYGVAPPPAPLGPQVPVAPGPPRAACGPVWRCGYHGCGWLPGCTPPPEFYPDGYGSPLPDAYPDPEAQQEPELYYPRYGYPGQFFYPDPRPY
jgi:hypothetical protein